MPITIKTTKDIALIREGGRLLAGILHELVEAARPGISTGELDAIAERRIKAASGAPAFKGYRAKGSRAVFPATICTSINDEAVHGIPRPDRILAVGDIVGIDIGMRWPEMTSKEKRVKSKEKERTGLYTDMAVTIGIGRIAPEAEKLLRITAEALEIGIRAARPGGHTGDIGHAVQQHLKKHHYGIIRNLAGHGVGYELHEEPLIPNYGAPGTGAELKPGLVIAIEPMATIGDWRVRLDRDGWTFKTADHSLAAHFEKTIAVTKNGVEVLTPF
ncbi:MAG: M24 family metallopeptidase [Patescibacteria group bacterium]